MKNADMPAMPLPNTYQDALEMGEPGLTKREHFAAMAMQGLLVSHPQAGEDYIAKQAVNQADALLAALDE